MKSITILLLLLCFTAAHGQLPCNVSYGTKTLYYPADTALLPAPDGYEPVFINYAGRHGARHMTGVKDLLLVLEMLHAADSARTITADGRALQRLTEHLLYVEQQSKAGSLSARGKAELEGIGRRIMTRFPFLRDTAHHWEVSATPQERTQQSAAAFLAGAGYSAPLPPQIHLAAADTLQLRFYDLAPGFRRFEKKGSWQQPMNQLYDSPEGNRTRQQIAARFLGIHLPAKQNTTSPQAASIQAFSEALFAMAGISDAIGTEITAAGFSSDSVNVRRMLPCSEQQWLGAVDDAQEFLKKGPGADINGIQVAIAAPLLADFISTTDDYITTGHHSAIFRFAHAETMAPLSALMRIQGHATPTTDVVHLGRYWSAAGTICFSANVAWVLYRKAQGGDYLVRILYNEQPAAIPVPTTLFPYYRWADVKAYYTRLLAQYHFTEKQDRYQYLMSLK